MGHFKFGIPIAGGIAAILSLAACSDENPWGNQTEETGTIRITLATDNEIETSKPMFRSEDNPDGRKRLGNFTHIPEPDEFSIRLEKTDGSYSKTWATLSDFKGDAVHGNFKTGSYTITAFYGEKGKEDFDAPYMEASSTITLLAGQEEDITLTAELKNSIVKVNYTEGFQNYMKDYYSSLRTEGRSEDIIYTKDETRGAFVEPIDSAALTVNFTTKDKGYNGAVKVGNFAPLAKTLHNVTLDVAENANGKATLNVIFDDSLEEDSIHIDLTEELLTTPAPEISCDGFEDGSTLDMLEGNSSDTSIKMNVYAAGTIAAARLIVESDNYTPIWGKEIDLCAASDEQKQQITAAGISVVGFGFNRPTDKQAFLDLSDYGMSLPNGVHTISLEVEDKNGAISKRSSVTLNSLPIELNLVGSPTIKYGSGEAVLTMDYNGFDAMNDIRFTTVDGYGMTVDAPIKSCEENTATRAYATKRYIYTISLPNTTRTEVEIKAYYKNNGKPIKTFKIPVIVPEYSIVAYDAFSRYAYMKVVATGTTDSSVLAAIVNNIIFKDSRLKVANRDITNGIITITGLTPGTTYTVESNITGENKWNANGTFTTEEELAIPNGEFKSKIVDGISFDNIEVGGKYNVWPEDYQHKSSIKRAIPAKDNGTSVEWATINDFTAYKGASTKNTWFIVPSTYIENEQAVIKTVGYHHSGTKPETSGGAFNTKYYCENAPTELKTASGELFLGSYSFDGQEHRTDGIGFASRPISISFDYKYVPYNGDTGYALIEIVDVAGNKLGSETFILESSANMTKKTLNFHYSSFGTKASKLIISFKSSNQGSSAPINIPTGESLKEDGINAGNFTSPPDIPANQYKAVATGSVLIIDNVKATYATEPAGIKAASKRKNNKRR